MYKITGKLSDHIQLNRICSTWNRHLGYDDSLLFEYD